jgi:hypothetical protein
MGAIVDFKVRDPLRLLTSDPANYIDLILEDSCRCEFPKPSELSSARPFLGRKAVVLYFCIFKATDDVHAISEHN